MSNEEVVVQMQLSVEDVERSRARVPLENAMKPEAKNRLVKARPNMERHAQEMVVAARNFPHHLRAGIADDLESELLFVEELRRYHAALENALQVVEDTLFVKMSRSYKMTLDIYNGLSRQASIEPEVLPGLESFAASLSSGKRRFVRRGRRAL